MTITVTKSPLALMNAVAAELLQNITNVLEKQKEHVKSVTVLANFSLDKLATLKHGVSIAQGLVVQVSKEYKLSHDDMTWFHPEIASGRAVFEVDSTTPQSKLADIDMDGLNSSIGEYMTSSPDDFGCQITKRHLVIDTSNTSVLEALYSKWLTTGTTAGDIDKQWKRMKFGDVYGIAASTQSQREAFATRLNSSARLVYSDTVRSVLSDTTSVYFTNNVVKQDSDGILIKSSALGGYRMYKGNNAKVIFYPATLGTSNEYYSWDDMTPRNCSRITHSCSWDGELSFNAAVMTPPAITGSKIREMEDEYEMSFRDTLAMNNARFSSSDDIRDAMAPKDLLKLHPSVEKMENAPTSISTPISMEHPVLCQLMNNLTAVQANFPSFHLFNPALLNNGRLQIPKEIYKQIA